MILTLSPGNGVAGSDTVSGARAAGHDATAIVAAAPAGGGAPGSAGAATASAGIAQPSARERHELGGGVVVGVGVGCGDCEAVGVCVGDSEAVGDGDGEQEGAAARPTAVQASSHGQGVGVVLLGAQKEPCGHAAEEPARQSVVLMVRIAKVPLPVKL